MKVYIAGDHRGFNLKKELVQFLKEKNVEVFDLGANEYDEKDDYPYFAKLVSEKVTTERGSLGVLLCGSGVGVDIASNKFDGIRASIGINENQVEAGRRDDNLNVLVIAADYVNAHDAKKMLNAFLDTPYEKNEKHDRRLDEIASFEKKQ